MSLFQSATENANLRHEYHLRTAEVLGQQGGEMIAQKIHKNGIAAAQAMLASPHCTQEQRQFCEKYLMDFMKSSIQYFCGKRIFMLELSWKGLISACFHPPPMDLCIFLDFYLQGGPCRHCGSCTTGARYGSRMQHSCPRSSSS